MASTFLCPKCFKEMTTNDVAYVCNNNRPPSPCPLAASGEPQTPANPRKPKCAECGRPLIIKVCPECRMELPMDIGETKNYSIAMLGAKYSGKSNYIAVLINQLRNEIGRSFDCALMARGDRTIQRYRDEFYNPLYRQRTVVRGTDAGEVEPLMYSLIFKRRGGLFRKAVNDAVALTFFDTAGENLNDLSTMSTYNSYLRHSDGIILLVDPLQLPVVRAQLERRMELPEENADASELLTRTIEVVRSGMGHSGGDRPIDIPIAVAFTKIDAVKYLIDPSSCLQNNSTHIQKGQFDEQDFRDTSDEMQSLVDNWAGMELTNLVTQNFAHYGFFGLSALGSNPDTNMRIPRFRPFRVADPFLWLLAEKKVIPAA